MKNVLWKLNLFVVLAFLPGVVKGDTTSLSCSPTTVQPGQTVTCSFNVVNATSYVISSLSADIIQTNNITATSFVMGSSDGFGEDISNGKIDYLTGMSTSSPFKIGDLIFKVSDNSQNGDYYIGTRNIVLYEDDFVTIHKEKEKTVKITVSGGNNTSQTSATSVTSGIITSQTSIVDGTIDTDATSNTFSSQTVDTSKTNSSTINNNEEVSNSKTGSGILYFVIFLFVISVIVVVSIYNRNYNKGLKK